MLLDIVSKSFSFSHLTTLKRLQEVCWADPRTPRDAQMRGALALGQGGHRGWIEKSLVRLWLDAVVVVMEGWEFRWSFLVVERWKRDERIGRKS